MSSANIHPLEELERKLSGLEGIAKLHALNIGIWENRHMNSGQFFDLAQQAVSLAGEYQEDILVADLAQAYLNLGNSAWNRSRPEIAFESLQKAYRLFKSIGMLGRAGFANAVLANLHSTRGEFEHAFSLVYQILDELKDQPEDEVIGLVYLSAGSFHFDLESYTEAFDYFVKSYVAFQNIGDEIGMARATNNAGTALYKLGRHEEGLEYCNKSLSIYERLNLDQGKAKSLRDIGKILQSQGKLDEAFDNFLRSLEIRDHSLKTKTGGIDGLITCLIDLGQVLNKMGNPMEAKAYLKRALVLSEESGSLPKTIKIHRRLSDSYKQEGDFENALKHLELFQESRQEMLGQETANKIKSMQTRYALDMTQKQAELEKIKNEELNQAYHRINTINRNMTDSLRYAKRIQNALLPSQQRFHLTYPNSFILNLPKDIVSGDFYWITQKNGFHLLAVADCSGHGVPGAFMSMVGMSLLNQIVNERGVLQPGKILNQINLALINNLNQMDEEGSSEGMDLALCVFDPNFSQVVFAGAKRSLYYIQNGEIQELKSSPYSIGYDPYTDFSEKIHRLDLTDVDSLYISTDGFADQFGEESGKKFMLTKFKNMLKDNCRRPMQEQLEVMKSEFFTWKGKEPQTDDVLLVGIRLK